MMMMIMMIFTYSLLKDEVLLNSRNVLKLTTNKRKLAIYSVTAFLASFNYMVFLLS